MKYVLIALALMSLGTAASADVVPPTPMHEADSEAVVVCDGIDSACDAVRVESAALTPSACMASPSNDCDALASPMVAPEPDALPRPAETRRTDHAQSRGPDRVTMATSVYVGSVSHRDLQRRTVEA